MARFISSPENIEITEALIDAIGGLNPGEILPNGKIENLVKGKRHLLAKARRIVQRRDGVVFATIIGVGIKRLKDEDVYVVGSHARKRAKNTTEKARKEIVGVIRRGDAVMDRETQLRTMNEINKLGLIAEFCMDDE